MSHTLHRGRLSIFVIALLQIRWQGAALASPDDSCVAIQYGDPSGQQHTHRIHPVTGFLSTHPAVQGQVCGQHFNVGDPIPPSGLWSKSGAEAADAVDCEAVPAGVLLYAYGFPEAFASGGGLAEKETEVLFFAMDESGAVSTVFVHDRANNLDGGQVNLLIDGSSNEGVAGRGVKVIFFDDVRADNFSSPGNWYGTCGSSVRDCHSWIEAEGRGFFTWKWGRGGSDGMVLGPIPPGGRMELSYNYIEGMTSLHFVDYNRTTGAVGRIPHTFNGGTASITIELGSCSLSPVIIPTAPPTTHPTIMPSHGPTNPPTRAPTPSPSVWPTIPPTFAPTRLPTQEPTVSPSMRPTLRPTEKPTPNPTVGPSDAPTVTPTQKPSASPTHSPSTSSPTRASPATTVYTTTTEIPASTSCTGCDFGTNGPCILLSDNLCFPFMSGTRKCPPTMWNCETPRPTLTTSVTTTSTSTEARCVGCLFGAGPCRHLATNACINFISGTNVCAQGTHECGSPTSATSTTSTSASQNRTTVTVTPRMTTTSMTATSTSTSHTTSVTTSTGTARPRTCHSCALDTSGPCLLLNSMLCFPFLDGTRACASSMINCNEVELASTVISTTTTRTPTTDISATCLNCPVGTKGPCRHLTSGACVPYRQNTTECHTGTHRCVDPTTLVVTHPSVFTATHTSKRSTVSSTSVTISTASRHACTQCSHGSEGDCFFEANGYCLPFEPGTTECPVGTVPCAVVSLSPSPPLHDSRESCTGCEFGSSGNCIFLNNRACVDFLPGTTECVFGSQRCLVDMTAAPTASSELWPSHCTECAFATSGTCKLISSGVCLDFNVGGLQCLPGSYSCGLTVELLFVNQIYTGILGSELARANFRQIFLEQVFSIVPLRPSEVGSLHLVEHDGDVLAALEVTSSARHILPILNSLARQCNFCVHYEGAVLCPRAFDGQECVSISPCTAHPCVDGSICVLDTNQATGFLCVCPASTSADCASPQAGDNTETSRSTSAMPASTILIVAAAVVTVALVLTFFVHRHHTTQAVAKLRVLRQSVASTNLTTDGTWDTFEAQSTAATRGKGVGMPGRHAPRSLTTLQSLVSDGPEYESIGSTISSIAKPAYRTIPEKTDTIDSLQDIAKFSTMLSNEGKAMHMQPLDALYKESSKIPHTTRPSRLGIGGTGFSNTGGTAVAAAQLLDDADLEQLEHILEAHYDAASAAVDRAKSITDSPTPMYDTAAGGTSVKPEYSAARDEAALPVYAQASPFGQSRLWRGRTHTLNVDECSEDVYAAATKRVTGVDSNAEPVYVTAQSATGTLDSVYNVPRPSSTDDGRTSIYAVASPRRASSEGTVNNGAWVESIYQVASPTHAADKGFRDSPQLGEAIYGLASPRRTGSTTP